ncbi:helix-turn-helix domain-containing protein [Neobacillus sp. PS2-9]|uniref:helix-turn-helix domain-containing protein n=1 Tax=Neobacillus sp. PS2-9 TaxID=3070676 RepID=UPI0027E1E264|nr:helix-turn-helix domain-containing protein [Neobacillus sp. PS2-9]WML60042.1 helix-turn-helix domain-containing protein [Neobacillus sp. PS2-9]
MIGRKIKEMRQKRGYSLSELAKQADVSKSYLSQIERGFQSNPSLQFLQKISIPLGTNIDYFIGESLAQKEVHIDLDDEWKSLIKKALENGLKKEDFREYLNYIKFQTWIKEQKK